jgi:hypothetical protein
MPQAFPNKTDLRHSALALRDALPASFRESAAKALAEQALFKAGGHIVSAYHAIGSEFDPKFLLEVLAEKGVHLALPVLLDKETMVFAPGIEPSRLCRSALEHSVQMLTNPKSYPISSSRPWRRFLRLGSASAMAKVTMIGACPRCMGLGTFQPLPGWRSTNRKCLPSRPSRTTFLSTAF